MPFLQTFQYSMYVQVFLASGMLLVAEGGAAPAMLTFVIGMVALIFNDRRGVFGLSEWWANGLAIAAFCVATVEFLGDGQEAKLLAGTHLIVYLLWIVLLWKREMRHFWWISALCLLHVALSAILTHEGWFGMVLVFYVVIMVWNLTLFSLYRAERDVLAAPSVYSSETGNALLYSVAGQSPRHSRVQGNVQSDFGVSHVGARLVLGSLTTAILGLLVGSLIFLLTPRMWVPTPQEFANSRTPGLPQSRAVTGFSEQVRLGDIGEILESSDPVLSLQVFDDGTQEPVDILELADAAGMNEPYLRGAVLVNYRFGTWHPSAETGRQRRIPPKPIGRRGWYRYEYTLEPLGTTLLFAMRPYGSGGLAGEVTETSQPVTLISPSYMLKHESESDRIKYHLYSPPPSNAPSSAADFTPFRRIASPVNRHELTASPGPRLRQLEALAKRIAAGVDQQTLNRDESALAVARALEAYLRESGEYRYTLNSSVMDPNVDPIEDFLFNRRAGHCEYYAAALTLMLRSVGIPSRLINGFKGGEYDPKSKTLRVEQRYAHSWVEAAVGDRWLTLDATPMAERERIVASHKPGKWDTVKRGFWQFWYNEVVTMSLSRQQQEVFRPMLSYLRKAFGSTAGMRAAAADFWNWFRTIITHPSRWISIEGGVLAFLVLGIPVLMLYAGRRLLRRLRIRWGGRTSAAARPTPIVEFYQRFQRIAKRQGLVRKPNQTQREFAAEFQHSLAGQAGPELAGAGRVITDSFYRVRFGDAALDPEEERRIEGQLQLVESWANRRST